MTARTNILARLRKTETVELAEPKDRSVLEEFWQYNEQEKLDRFQQLMEAVHTEVHRVTRSSWAEKLKSVLAEKGINKLITGTGFDELNEIDRVCTELERIEFDQPFEQLKSDLFHNIPAGFTRSEGAIAATGSVIMRPGPKEPRTLSLVPPLHICLVDAAQLFNTLDEAMAQQGWAGNMPTNMLLVSGPSKTADIQQTLAYGAHGPKEMVVLLITE